MPVDFSSLPDDPEQLEQFIRNYEEGIEGIKSETRATIEWANSEYKALTDYALVYLHGFKASYGEGEPVHRQLAQRFGFNLYLSRLYKHGLDDPDAFRELKADHFTASAEQALHIGRKLGRKIIIMGTSTGGLLALYLASLPRYRSCIAGLLLYSPLIRFYGWKNMLLTNQLGRVFLRITPGKEYVLTTSNASEEEQKIWYSSYHLQGALALGKLVQETMHRETFAQVKCPVFTGYYYKNRWNQDNIVSVSAIKRMFRQLGTKEQDKELVNFPDAQSHVICNPLLSESTEAITEQSSTFLQKIMALNTL